MAKPYMATLTLNKWVGCLKFCALAIQHRSIKAGDAAAWQLSWAYLRVIQTELA